MTEPQQSNDAGRPNEPSRPPSSSSQGTPPRRNEPGRRNDPRRRRDSRRRNDPEHKPRFSRPPHRDRFENRPTPAASVSLKRRVWNNLELHRPTETATRIVNWCLLTLIALNVCAVMLASVDWINARYGTALLYFKHVSITVFTVEYLTRIWSCVSETRYAGFLRGRIRFALTPLALIDLFAILPAFVSMGGVDLRVLRGLRLMRVFRLFRSGRYNQAPAMIARVLRGKREELIVCLVAVGLLLFVAATLVYFVEHNEPQSGFLSIPASFGWAVAIITSVGSSDITPLTTLGKIMGGLISVLGIGFIAVTAGILCAGFLDELKQKQPHQSGKCPRCGYRP